MALENVKVLNMPRHAFEDMNISFVKALANILQNIELKEQKMENFQDTMQNLTTKKSYIDRGNIGIYKTQNKPYDSVMKNLAERIKTR